MQFYYIVNIDRREYLNPAKLGITYPTLSTIATNPIYGPAMALLLSEEGGNLVQFHRKALSRWAGHRIIMAAEYAEAEVPNEDKQEFLRRVERGAYNRSLTKRYLMNCTVNLYLICSATSMFKDISWLVLDTLLDDPTVSEAVLPQYESPYLTLSPTAGGPDKRLRVRIEGAKENLRRQHVQKLVDTLN